MSSDTRRGGRAATPHGAAVAALHAGRKAGELVAHDTEVSYLANSERQLAIERLLIRFGEALKSIPSQTLTQIDSSIAWAGPKGFRDIASHWYDVEEIEANAFAGALLMPEDFLRADLENLVLDMEDDKQLKMLAKRYQVSTQAITFRLINLHSLGKI